MKKILVAVDGSENAHRALMKAKELGKPFNSHITILHVIEDHVNPSLFGIDSVDASDVLLQRDLKKMSKKLLEDYMELFVDYNPKVKTLTRSGKPANEILEASKEEDIDLIVMGSRGLGAIPGAMLGSVSHKIINKSDISVLIVK